MINSLLDRIAWATERKVLTDACVVLAGTLATLSIAMATKIFPDPSGHPYAPEDLEPNEMLLTLGVFFTGVLWALRRQRRAARAIREEGRRS